MSCYFRHLKELFEELGVTPTKENKRELDRVFHEAVAVAYKECPATWREVKARLQVPRRRAALVRALSTRLRRAGLTRPA